MKTLVIGDTQIRPDFDEDVIRATAKYIEQEAPDEIVIIGDWFDFESLSQYACRRQSDGLRLKADVKAGLHALGLLMDGVYRLKYHREKHHRRRYNPKIVFTMGNHEERLVRYIDNRPELEGSLYDIKAAIEGYGIKVYDFLAPYIGLGGVHYFHYLANPMSSKAIGGSMDNKLNKVTYSFVHGHQQQFQYAERQQVSGKPQFGICVGAFYEHDEGYKGVQGNTHSRGTVILHHHEGEDGGCDVEFMSCHRIKSTYL